MKLRALIVGIDQYSNPNYRNLEGAVNDAYAVRHFLTEEWGYEVEFIKSWKVHPGCLLRQAKSMVNGLGKDDLFLFYFAGHGIGFDGRIRLLLPEASFKAVIERRDHESFFVDELESETSDSACNRLLIIDACRDDPYEGITRSASGKGSNRETLAHVIDSESVGSNAGSLTKLFSCRERTAANEIGDRGLFSLALLDGWKTDARETGRVVLDMAFYERLHARMNELAQESDLITSPQEPRIELGARSPVLYVAKDGTRAADSNEEKQKDITAKNSTTTRRQNKDHPAYDDALAVNTPSAWMAYLKSTWSERVSPEDANGGVVDRCLTEALAGAWPRNNKLTDPYGGGLLSRGKLFKRPGNFLIPELGIPMIWVHAGSLKSSITLEAADQPFGFPREADVEMPFSKDESVSEIVFSKGFWLSKQPVTQLAWFVLMAGESNEVSYDPNGFDLPVLGAALESATIFCERLNRREADAGSLPEGFRYSIATNAQFAFTSETFDKGDLTQEALADASNGFHLVLAPVD